jgi:hypothetical protein
MSTPDGGHRDAAIASLSTREYRTAGDEYARAGWRVLADPRDGVGTFDADERGWVGVGLQHLLTSSLCYRVAAATDRASHRAVEGIAVARDLEYGPDHPVQHACLREFVADFRTAGGLDGATDAYDAAADAYRDAAPSIDDPQRWATSPLFRAAESPLQQLARGGANGEIAVAWDDLHGSDPSDPGRFLAHRATYKRQRFRGLLDRAVDDGHLAAPRGTTEYDTDHHRCSHCESTDVNWVGERVLCLRCSRPTTEQ